MPKELAGTEHPRVRWDTCHISFEPGNDPMTYTLYVMRKINFREVNLPSKGHSAIPRLRVRI